LRTFLSRAFGRASRASPWDSHEAVRAELFSVERLEQHARTLAVAQPVTPGPTKGQPLARRLADNGAMLLDAYREIAGTIDQRRAITPAAEWLVDNYYLVERQIREIRSALPPSYYRQLPKLADGPFAGYPRVYRRGGGAGEQRTDAWLRRGAVARLGPSHRAESGHGGSIYLGRPRPSLVGKALDGACRLCCAISPYGVD